MMIYDVLTLRFVEVNAAAIARWHLRKDGSLVFVLIYSTPIVFNQRAARMVVAQDVTEQQLVDDQVRQSEANLLLAQRVARMAVGSLT